MSAWDLKRRKSLLEEIFISNFILIDEMRIQFSKGLNVLTGETGAGKSIIIDALGLLMGERVKNDYLRDNNRKGLVEAVFYLAGNQEARSFLEKRGLIDEGEEIAVISREIQVGGKSVARVNGRTVTATLLKNLSSSLIDMHLQDDRENILRPAMYLQYVDSFAAGEQELLSALGSKYTELKESQRQLEKLKFNQQERNQRKDFLEYQIKEIEAAHLYVGEEEELQELAARIQNSQRLAEGSARVLQSLYSASQGFSAYDLVFAALEQVRELKNDSFFLSLMEPLENIYYSLEDIAHKISGFGSELEFEPGLLEETEDRLYLIKKLQGKYGQSIEHILAYLEKARQEIDILDNSEEKEEQLEYDIQAYYQEYMQLATQISQKRRAAAKVLEAKVHEELSGLNMPHIRFMAHLTERKEPGSLGIDEVEFLFSPNPGEVMRPVARIASGGEISRFILALKKALATAYQIPTLIFDEIDVGVGGSALNAMALKLGQLSQSHQVILVTHSPQVASYADRHYLIEKQVREQKTFTVLRELAQEERLHELARMLDGDGYSDLTLKHARQMLTKGGLF